MLLYIHNVDRYFFFDLFYGDLFLVYLSTLFKKTLINKYNMNFLKKILVFTLNSILFLLRGISQYFKKLYDGFIEILKGFFYVALYISIIGGVIYFFVVAPVIALLTTIVLLLLLR